MPNTFEEQAKERFRKSLAFLQKANALLQDDLVFRSALADSVSATKNMLQGYLLLRIAANPTSVVTQRWQEAAIGARMPDLLRACDEAGLHLHGLERDIQRLNNERNYRAHDDPQRFVDPVQAERAYELAITVQRRIKAAVQGSNAEVVGVAPASTRSASSRISAPVRAAVSNTLDKVAAAARSSGTASATATAATRGAGDSAASAHPGSASGKNGASATAADAAEEELATTDDTYAEMPALSRRSARRGPSFAARVALLAAALLIGVVAGFGVSIPVANGAAPSFLDFAKGFYVTPTIAATVAPTATLDPTAAPQTSPVQLGALAIDQPRCVTGVLQVTLVNAGAISIQYAAGTSSESASIGVDTSASQPSRFSTLAANSNVTLSVHGLAARGDIIVVTSSGSVHLLAPTC